MSMRDHYPSGVPCWVDTPQRDPDAAVRFYGDLFGWRFEGPGEMPGDPPGKYFVAQLNDGRDIAGVSSQPFDFPLPRAVWNTYIATDDVAALAAAVRREGGHVLAPPFDAPPAGRMAVFADPAGAVFSGWQAQARCGAQRINEPSAWAMSALLTDDPDRAAAFYGAVFGWKPEPLVFGDRTVTLFRLPGYVGGEPQQPVPRDVVAVMEALDPDRLPKNVPPPHWNVDFWIADADRAATKAVELGGRVLAPVSVSPGFRTVVLADPQGATFSLSQLIRDRIAS